MTLDKLRVAHNSVPGNPLLAESLYLAEYIERMGTGTLDMIRRCAQAGLPEPTFTMTDGFVTTVSRHQPDSSGVQAESTDKDTSMLRACVEGPVTSRELQVSGGYSGRIRPFERRLEHLLRKGLLERTVPDKPRSPLQKYRLTDKGRAALAEAGDAKP